MFGSTSIRSTVVTGQTEGLKVGCVGKNKVFIKPLALGWAEGEGMGGLQKLITFFSGWAGLQKLITDLDMKNG